MKRYYISHVLIKLVDQSLILCIQDPRIENNVIFSNIASELRSQPDCLLQT